MTNNDTYTQTYEVLTDKQTIKQKCSLSNQNWTKFFCTIHLFLVSRFARFSLVLSFDFKLKNNGAHVYDGSHDSRSFSSQTIIQRLQTNKQNKLRR